MENIKRITSENRSTPTPLKNKKKKNKFDSISIHFNDKNNINEINKNENTLKNNNNTSPNKQNIHQKDILLQFDKIETGLHESNDWLIRIQTLKQFVIIAEKIYNNNDNKSNDYDTNDPLFLDFLKKIRNLLALQVLDLRSQVVKESCEVIKILVKLLSNNNDNKIENNQNKFGIVADILVQALLKQITVSVQIISKSANEAILCIIENTKFGYSQLVGRFIEGAKSRSQLLRRFCVDYLFRIYQRWHPSLLERYVELMVEMFCSTLADPHSDVRALSRKFFVFFRLQYPEKGEDIYRKIDMSTKKALADDNKKIIPNDQESTAKRQSLVRKINLSSAKRSTFRYNETCIDNINEKDDNLSLLSMSGAQRVEVCDKYKIDILRKKDEKNSTIVKSPKEIFYSAVRVQIKSQSSDNSVNIYHDKKKECESPLQKSKALRVLAKQTTDTDTHSSTNCKSQRKFSSFQNGSSLAENNQIYENDRSSDNLISVESSDSMIIDKKNKLDILKKKIKNNSKNNNDYDLPNKNGRFKLLLEGFDDPNWSVRAESFEKCFSLYFSDNSQSVPNVNNHKIIRKNLEHLNDSHFKVVETILKNFHKIILKNKKIMLLSDNNYLQMLLQKLLILKVSNNVHNKSNTYKNTILSLTNDLLSFVFNQYEESDLCVLLLNKANSGAYNISKNHYFKIQTVIFQHLLDDKLLVNAEKYCNNVNNMRHVIAKCCNSNSKNKESTALVCKQKQILEILYKRFTKTFLICLEHLPPNINAHIEKYIIHPSMKLTVKNELDKIHNSPTASSSSVTDSEDEDGHHNLILAHSENLQASEQATIVEKDNDFSSFSEDTKENVKNISLHLENIDLDPTLNENDSNIDVNNQDKQHSNDAASDDNDNNIINDKMPIHSSFNNSGSSLSILELIEHLNIGNKIDEIFAMFNNIVIPESEIINNPERNQLTHINWEKDTEHLLLLLLELIKKNVKFFRTLKIMLKNLSSFLGDSIDIVTIKLLQWCNNAHDIFRQGAEKVILDEIIPNYPEKTLLLLSSIIHPKNNTLSTIEINNKSVLMNYMEKSIHLIDDNDFLLYHLEDLFFIFSKALDDMDITVRKSAVFAIAAMHKKIKKNINNYIDKLDSYKQKLINFYIIEEK